MVVFDYNFGDFIFQFLLGCIVTFAFAIFFNAPKKSLFVCSIIGASGWLLFLILKYFNIDVVVATYVSAMLVGIFSTNASKILKMPATIFIYTGIIPLVPGYSMYYTMQHLVTKQYFEATKLGIDTILKAGAIAMGILVASVFSDSIKRVKLQRIKK